MVQKQIEKNLLNEGQSSPNVGILQAYKTAFNIHHARVRGCLRSHDRGRRINKLGRLAIRHPLPPDWVGLLKKRRWSLVHNGQLARYTIRFGPFLKLAIVALA
jgi:hypothetical protein